jgi:prepilin peptidase CpaA
MSGQAFVFLYPVALVVAAISDVLSLRIPNWISVVLAVWFVLYGLVFGLSLSVIALRLGLGACVFVTGFLIYNLGMIGGGDVKLIAVSAIWVGWPDLVVFLLLVAISGGVLAAAVLIFRKMPVPVPNWLLERGWYSRLTTEGQGIPYGLAICAAGIFTFPNTLAGLAVG